MAACEAHCAAIMYLTRFIIYYVIFYVILHYIIAVLPVPRCLQGPLCSCAACARLDWLLPHPLHLPRSPPLPTQTPSYFSLFPNPSHHCHCQCTITAAADPPPPLPPRVSLLAPPVLLGLLR